MKSSNLKANYVSATRQFLSLTALVFLVIACSAPRAKADVEIYGRISGLGQWQASNYVSSVWVEDDHGVWYPGYYGYSSGKGGLYWAAHVPSWANRSYQVWVFSSLGHDTIWSNPETAYGSWWWGGGSSQRGPTVTFWLKHL